MPPAKHEAAEVKASDDVLKAVVRDRLIAENEFPDIPAGWSVERLRFLLRESKERNGKEPVGDMLSVSEYRGVVPKEYEHEEQRRSEEELENYRVVRPGQLAVNSMWLNHLGLGVSDHLGYVSPAYGVYDISPRLDRRYVHHLVRSNFYLKLYLRYLYGIRPNSFQIKANDWGSLPIIVPDLPTQRQIADFLDRETARIDLLIEKKQRFATLAEAEFVDRISILVTSGQVKGESFKSTSTEWVPHIPSSWSEVRLKFLCTKIVDCLHETPEHDEGGEYPSIRTSDVVRGGLRLADAKRVNHQQYHHRIQRLEPKENDILYTREGERFGLAALVPPGVKLCLGQRMMMFRANRRVHPGYLMWSLNGKVAYNILKSGVAGATSPHLNIFDIRNVPVFLPSLQQQQEIVVTANDIFAKKERLVEASERAIDRLREYRSALITAAVTGQIEPATWSRKGEGDRRLDAIEEEMSA